MSDLSWTCSMTGLCWTCRWFTWLGWADKGMCGNWDLPDITVPYPDKMGACEGYEPMI